MEKITQVTVFQDRALITRTQTAQIEQDQTVSFLKLPQNVQMNSLRAKSQGQAKLKIRSINQRYEYLEKYSQEDLQKLLTELDELEDKLKLKQEFNRKYADFLVLMQNLKPQNNAELPERFDYQKFNQEDILSLYHFSSKQTATLEEQIYQIKIEERTLKEQKKLLAKKLEKMQSGQTKKELNIDLAVEMIEQGNADLNLNYVMPNASWRPFYEARLFLNQEELEMLYLAEVSQTTGEDWNDVHLILSTARPAPSAILPELKTWWVDFYQPPKTGAPTMSKKYSRKLVDSGAEIDMAMSPIMEQCKEELPCEECEIEAPAPEETEGEVAYSEIKSEGLNVSFIIPKNDSIGSDGNEKKVTVDKKKFPVKVEYIVIPKLSPNAFLKVTFENQSGYPYLAGAVSIFHASDYIGKTQLGTTVMGQEVELFMGSDDNVQVERVLIGEFLSKKLFGGNKKKTYRYKTMLSNYRENEVKISVYDHLPITQNAEVKVKLESLSLNYTEIDKKNIMRWDLALKPKEKIEIILEFSVEYPKEAFIYGL